MAKLKMYEIDAIVKTIVSKIEEHNKSKLVEPHKKEIDSLKRKYALIKQAEAEYAKAENEFRKKYSNHCVDAWRGEVTVKPISNKIEVAWEVKGEIKNQIIMSQVTGSDVEKLIDSIVKEHIK